jgi:hypothetical protein
MTTPIMLTTFDSVASTIPTHDEDDTEVPSPPASTEADDTNDGDLEAPVDDEGLQPQPLDYEEEDGEVVEEYGEDLDCDMDVDIVGEIENGRVSLQTVIVVIQIPNTVEREGPEGRKYHVTKPRVDSQAQGI